MVIEPRGFILGKSPKGIGVFAQVGVLLALLTTLAGCSLLSSAKPVARRPLVISVASIPSNLNPALASGDPSITKMVDSLFLPSAFLLDSGGNLVLNTPYVTSAEIVSVNPQVIVYKINQKAIWSDGHPLSALDFIYTWESQKAGVRGIVPKYLSSLVDPTRYNDISSVVSNSTGSAVTVTLSHPDSSWRSFFNPVFPARYMQANGFVASMSLGQLAFPTIGSYRIADYSSTSIGFKAKKGAVASFSGVTFESGLAVSPSSGSLSANIYPPGVIQSGASGTFGFVSGSTLTSLRFNTTASSLTMRNGLAYAIDRRALWSNLFGHSPLSSYEYNPPGNNLFMEGQSDYKDQQGYFMLGDPARAERSLIMAGYTYSPNGIFYPTSGSSTIDLVYNSTSALDSKVATMIASVWRYYGLSVTLDPKNSKSALNNALSSGAFTAAIVDIPITGAVAPLVQPFVPLAGASYSSILGSSPVGTKNTVRSAGAQVYPLNSSRLYNKIDALIWGDMAALPLFQVPQQVVFGSSISSEELHAALTLITSGNLNSSAFITLG